MKKTAFLTATSIVAAARNADAAFSTGAGEPEEINDQEFVADVVTQLRRELSANQLENLEAIVRMAIA